MLTPAQFEFCEAFGYVVLDPDPPLAELMGQLEDECARALSIAYPGTVPGTLILPAMSSHNVVSLQLLEHPSILALTESYLGPNAIVKPAKITRFARPTRWHRDCYMDLRGLKMAIYLGTEESGTVPFDLIPGSHRGRILRLVDSLLSIDARVEGGIRDPNRVLPPTVPTHTVHLRAGQILVFDLGLWHANLSSKPRLQWAATFLEEPASCTARTQIVAHLGEFFQEERSYPKDLFPYFPPSWMSGADDSQLARALTRTGVLAEFVATYGEGK